MRNKTEEMGTEFDNQDAEIEPQNVENPKFGENQFETVAPAVALFLRKTYQLCIRKITLICDKLYEKLPHTKRKMRQVGKIEVPNQK